MNDTTSKILRYTALSTVIFLAVLAIIVATEPRESNLDHVKYVEWERDRAEILHLGQTHSGSMRSNDFTVFEVIVRGDRYLLIVTGTGEVVQLKKEEK
jgi:hypothetical protein